MASGTIKGNGWKVIYTNNSPNSDQGEISQTVDLSAYSEARLSFMIYKSTSARTEYRYMSIDGDISLYMIWFGAYIPTISVRNVHVLSTGYTIEHCKQKAANSNSAPTQHDSDLIIVEIAVR